MSKYADSQNRTPLAADGAILPWPLITHWRLVTFTRIASAPTSTENFSAVSDLDGEAFDPKFLQLIMAQEKVAAPRLYSQGYGKIPPVGGAIVAAEQGCVSFSDAVTPITLGSRPTVTAGPPPTPMVGLINDLNNKGFGAQVQPLGAGTPRVVQILFTQFGVAPPANDIRGLLMILGTRDPELG